MTLRNIAGNALLAASVAAIAISLGAAPALAATTLTVKVTHGGSFVATTSEFTLSDRGTSLISCTGLATPRFSGAIPTATDTGTSPVKVGTISSVRSGSCSGSSGTATLGFRGLPYPLLVFSKTNSAGETDLATGMNIAVSSTSCTFSVTGDAPGFYSNSNHTWHLTPSLPVKAPINGLTASGVTGCVGLVSNGDQITLKAIYTLSRALKINST